jgi:hypothetical protein
VKIDPNGVEDFLRYSVTIPSGWTAEKIEEDGSSYMMEENTVKFLWSRVGQRDELNVSFRLSPPAEAEGTFEFNGKLSHSVNNLPSHVKLDPFTVAVGKAGQPNNGKYVQENGDSTQNPVTNVTVSRIVPTGIVTGEFIVDVTIQKGELGSFIKLQDSLPAGFAALPVKNDGGQWSFEDGVVRIEWYSPSKANPVLNVQYKVVVSPDMSGSYTINGHVSYVENMQNKLVRIAPAPIQLKEDPALANNNNNQDTAKENTNNNANNQNNNIGKEEPVVKTNNNTGNQEETNRQTQENNGTQQDPFVNKTPGVSYTVQVAAMKRRVETTYYESTFKLDKVNAEQVDGLNKYTTGSFTTYQDARNSRETVRSKGVVGPFVVAYNQGKRITVQEALMITSQKWIQ